MPSRDALSFLSARLGSSDADERRLAVAALGAFGSSWGWEARGADVARSTGDALRREAAAKIVDVIERGGLDVPANVLVEAIAVIAHPSAKPLLEKVKGDTTLPQATRDLAGRALELLAIGAERRERLFGAGPRPARPGAR